MRLQALRASGIDYSLIIAITCGTITRKRWWKSGSTAKARSTVAAAPTPVPLGNTVQAPAWHRACLASCCVAWARVGAPLTDGHGDTDNHTVAREALVTRSGTWRAQPAGAVPCCSRWHAAMPSEACSGRGGGATVGLPLEAKRQARQEAPHAGNALQHHTHIPQAITPHERANQRYSSRVAQRHGLGPSTGAACIACLCVLTHAAAAVHAVASSACIAAVIVTEHTGTRK